MNKIQMFALVMALVFVAGFAPSAHAAVVCESPDHSIWNAFNDAKVGCISDASWRAALAAQVPATDKDIVFVPSGQSVRLAWGFVDTCPTYIRQGCVINKSLLAQ